MNMAVETENPIQDPVNPEELSEFSLSESKIPNSSLQESLKCNFKISDLIRALSVTESVRQSISTIPILSHILIESEPLGVKLTASDTGITVQASVPAKVDVPGSTTVHGKSLMDFLKTLAGDMVKFDQKPARVRVSSGRSRMDIPRLNPLDFPSFSAADPRHKVSAMKLARVFEQVLKAMSSDPSRGILCGISLTLSGKDMTAAGTDGRRLHLALAKDALTESVDPSISAVLPRESIPSILKILSMSAQDEQSMAVLGFESGYLSIKSGPYLFVSRVVEGTYPDFSKIIPASAAKMASVQKDIFLQALKRVRLADPKTATVKLLFKPKELRLFAAGPNMLESEDVIDVDYDGEEFEFGVNSSYLVEAIDPIQDKRVFMDMNGNLEPVTVRGNDAGIYRGILMPVRIS